MTHQYLVAPRRAMIIRLVETAEIERHIVDERRPLWVDGEVAAAQEGWYTMRVVLGIAACAGIVIGLAGLVAWSLQQFLTTLT